MENLLQVLKEATLFILTTQLFRHLLPGKKYLPYENVILSMAVLSMLIVPILSVADADFPGEFGERVALLETENEMFSQHLEKLEEQETGLFHNNMADSIEVRVQKEAEAAGVRVKGVRLLEDGTVFISVSVKGGSDADFSNRALVRIIHSVLERQGINPAVCTLLPPDREATAELLGAVGLVDLIIPRGSSSLIHFVREHAKVPVIETGAGICHTYFDRSGDKGKGREIVNNAKTRRVSVCNALDCLIIHRERLSDLPYICGKLPDSNVIIYADEPAYAALSEHYPETLLQQANENSFGTEFLDYKMSIRTVSSLDEALSHIARYSSKHSESIISEDPETIRRFQQLVDAACVYANVSTAFTDGAQFGFGAEIGISTQKLHARGPMALPELTTYKYIIEGDGQTRI